MSGLWAPEWHGPSGCVGRTCGSLAPHEGAHARDAVGVAARGGSASWVGAAAARTTAATGAAKGDPPEAAGEEEEGRRAAAAAAPEA